MSALVGSAIIICPGCGKSFDVGIWLASVELRYKSLVSSLRASSVEHECEGSVA